MNDIPQYTVKPYLHGAELIMPDGTPTGFFANRFYVQKDGIRRAEVIAEALNERIELECKLTAANNEIADRAAREATMEKELVELRAKVAHYEAAFKSANETEAANE